MPHTWLGLRIAEKLLMDVNSTNCRQAVCGRLTDKYDQTRHGRGLYDVNIAVL